MAFLDVLGTVVLVQTVLWQPTLAPPAGDQNEYVSPPAYEFGDSYYRLGTWPTKEEATAHARDFRLEMTVRDTPRASRLSPWALQVMVVPDLRSTYAVVLGFVSKRSGDSLCSWLQRDSGPFATNPDGSAWVAWPAWERRGYGRNCQKLTFR